MSIQIPVTPPSMNPLDYKNPSSPIPADRMPSAIIAAFKHSRRSRVRNRFQFSADPNSLSSPCLERRIDDRKSIPSTSDRSNPARDIRYEPGERGYDMG
jgi:hypothetical protein